MKNKANDPLPEARGRSRRRLLQLLAIGGVFTGSRALPESWIRPVIEEATLPAHAQMSPTDQDGGTDTFNPDLEPDLVQENGP